MAEDPLEELFRAGEPEDEAPNAQDLAEIMANAMSLFMTMIDPVKDAVLGYKNGMVVAGFSEHIAENMALQFHALIMGKLMQSLSMGE